MEDTVWTAKEQGRSTAQGNISKMSFVMLGPEQVSFVILQDPQVSGSSNLKNELCDAWGVSCGLLSCCPVLCFNDKQEEDRSTGEGNISKMSFVMLGVCPVASCPAVLSCVSMTNKRRTGAQDRGTFQK